MNIPISEELRKRFDHVSLQKHTFGSRLFNVHDENSDTDIMYLYHYDEMFDTNLYLPNLHSFQFKDEVNNIDTLYLTYEQFWTSLYNGDGTMYADILLFGNWFDKELAFNICRTYKIIKAYCGSAKRDITLNKTHDIKILRRSSKNLYIANCLLDNEFPDIKEIQQIYKSFPDFKALLSMEEILRKQANDLFNSNTLHNYYIQETGDELLNIMLKGNNMKEYKFVK